MYLHQVSLWTVITVVFAALGPGDANMHRRGPSKPAQLILSAPLQLPGEDARIREARPGAGKAPASEVVGAKRALLIGVTKYDNLSRANLSGPVNDVHLMRELLEKSYRFPADAIVNLTEDEGKPNRRPTRANIEREFHNLADKAHEGDQIVILLAGHGDRQPADPDNREPDGIDEIFLPADIRKWQGFPEKAPNAIVDKELARWLAAITAKKAHVWIIFDCCHSCTMTRKFEVVRELRPGVLVPEEEMNKARERAAGRNKARGEPERKAPAFVPREPSDYLVAVYACRENETTPEGPQPPDSPTGKHYGLLTYSLVEILTKSAASKTPLTYRELVQRLQIRYAARPGGAPTPLVEGKGQGQVVLGSEQPLRNDFLLGKRGEKYKINAGSLHGLTTGSILAVHSPIGTDKESKLLGHVRVTDVYPFESSVEPCGYEKTPLTKDLPLLSVCQPVAIEYGLRRFKVAVHTPEGQATARQQIIKALEPLAGEKDGLITIVEEPREAEWLVRLENGKLQLMEASGDRAPFALPAPASPSLGESLRRNLEKIFRARNLIAISGRFEEQRYRNDVAVDVDVQILRHKDEKAPGEVWPQPADGWRFRPGDLISFRIKNKSESYAVDVTLLVVGSDFQIQPFYPKAGEVAKSIKPGESIDTPPPPGGFSDEPPLGPECLVVIAVPARNPPANFSALTQDGVAKARLADGSKSLQSPLGELLESAMFRTGARGPLAQSVVEHHGMRILTWTTEPARGKTP